MESIPRSKLPAETYVETQPDDPSQRFLNTHPVVIKRFAHAFRKHSALRSQYLVADKTGLSSHSQCVL
jgi:hypothetical protein